MVQCCQFLFTPTWKCSGIHFACRRLHHQCSVHKAICEEFETCLSLPKLPFKFRLRLEDQVTREASQWKCRPHAMRRSTRWPLKFTIFIVPNLNYLFDRQLSRTVSMRTKVVHNLIKCIVLRFLIRKGAYGRQ